MSTIPVTDDLIKKVLNENVIEEIYTGALSGTIGAIYTKAVSGSIDDGFVGLVVDLAVSADSTVTAFVKRDEKQYYENGLVTTALSGVDTATGVDKAIPLLIRVKEKGTWELGFTRVGGAGSINYRIRIRKYRKGTY
jgi:hypothetical protein